MSRGTGSTLTMVPEIAENAEGLEVSTLVGDREGTPSWGVQPHDVRGVLGRHLLVDGFGLVFDTRASRGSWFIDAQSGERYLDLYTFFASAALGAHPPCRAADS